MKKRVTAVFAALLLGCFLSCARSPTEIEPNSRDPKTQASAGVYRNYREGFSKALSWSGKDGFVFGNAEDRSGGNLDVLVSGGLNWNEGLDSWAQVHFDSLRRTLLVLDRQFRAGTEFDHENSETVASAFGDALVDTSGAPLFKIVVEGLSNMQEDPEYSPDWAAGSYEGNQVSRLTALQSRIAPFVRRSIDRLQLDQSSKTKLIRELCDRMLRKLALNVVYRFVQLVQPIESRLRDDPFYEPGLYEKDFFIDFRILMTIPHTFFEHGRLPPSTEQHQDAFNAAQKELPKLSETEWYRAFDRASTLISLLESSVKAGIASEIKDPQPGREEWNWAQKVSEPVFWGLEDLLDISQLAGVDITTGIESDLYGFVVTGYMLHFADEKSLSSKEKRARQQAYLQWLRRWAEGSPVKK